MVHHQVCVKYYQISTVNDRVSPRTCSNNAHSLLVVRVGSGDERSGLSLYRLTPREKLDIHFGHETLDDECIQSVFKLCEVPDIWVVFKLPLKADRRRPSTLGASRPPRSVSFQPEYRSQETTNNARLFRSKGKETSPRNSTTGPQPHIYRIYLDSDQDRGDTNETAHHKHSPETGTMGAPPRICWSLGVLRREVIFYTCLRTSLPFPVIDGLSLGNAITLAVRHDP